MSSKPPSNIDRTKALLNTEMQKRVVAAYELLSVLRTKLAEAEAGAGPVRVPVQVYFNVMWNDAFVTDVSELPTSWTVDFHRYNVRLKDWIDPWVDKARRLRFDPLKLEWKSEDSDGLAAGPAIHIRQLWMNPIRLSKGDSLW